MSEKWKSDLRKVARRAPSKDVLQTILNIMRSEADDRATAILAATLAEVSLIGPIAQITGQHANIEELFWSRDALFSTFARRVEGATLLRVVGPKTCGGPSPDFRPGLSH